MSRVEDNISRVEGGKKVKKVKARVTFAYVSFTFNYFVSSRAWAACAVAEHFLSSPNPQGVLPGKLGGGLWPAS